MSNTLRIAVEVGPKGKKVVAVAQDWPGLSRGANTEELALERIRSYVPRYLPVAERAGMHLVDGNVEVVERYGGTGSTDFWGISFGFSQFDTRRAGVAALEREITLMCACWAFFDDVASTVSAELRKGPRGGGRDRDRIIRHTIAAEQDFARRLGMKPIDDLPLPAPDLQEYRAQYCAAIREHHREARLARTWPLRFLIRHTAFHTLDHAWEMQDKDLTGR